MVGAVAVGDQAGPGELVEARLLEADREGLHSLPLLAGRQRRQAGGVDTPGEQHADRHVGDQVGAHRVAQRLAQLIGQSGLRPLPDPLGRHRPRPRVALLAQRTVPPAERAPRWQLARLGEDRQRRRDRVEGEEGSSATGIDGARETGQLEHRLELRGKRDGAVGDAVVERLDPEAVTGQQQAPLARVPDRQGEHPAQPLEEGVAVLLVEVDEHLGVGGGGEAVSPPLQLSAQLAVVVDLAVLDDDRCCRPRWRSAGDRRRGR